MSSLLRLGALPFEPASLPEVSVVEGGLHGIKGEHEVLVMLVHESAAPADARGVDAADMLLEANAELRPLESLGGLRLAIKTQRFTGKKGQVLPPVLLHGVASASPSPLQLVLIGLGKQLADTPQQQQQQTWGPSAFHAAGGALGSFAKLHGVEAVAVHFWQAKSLLDDAAAAAEITAFALAALAGLYEGNIRYRSKPESKVQLQTIKLWVPASAAPGLAEAAARGVAIARGNLLARFLAEAPANVCTPSHLAAAAAHIAALAPERFTLKVLEEPACRQLGMGCFVGVSQGSEEPLRFIHLTHTAAGEVKHRVALVGKAVTFDTGGLNLKTSGGIEAMKIDMGGAAAVLGAARALAELPGLAEGIEVRSGVAPPRLWLRGWNRAGLTVEVNDTDAEGRLTLADALWYAQAHAGAQTVVDIATLTGAAGIALGQGTGALFANDDAIAAAVEAASRAAGESLWRMPLNEDLRCKLDSPIADLKNYAGRWGGAITAALFLKEFIQEGTAWAHLDVAGPAWDDAAGVPTGFGTATLVELLTRVGRGRAAAAAT